MHRPWRPLLGPDRLTGIGITIHLLIAAAALTAVQVARPGVLQELSVRITPEKIKPAQEVMPLSRLTVPTAVTVPPPMTVQTAAKPVTSAPLLPHPRREKLPIGFSWNGQVSLSTPEARL